jgi:alcohol dehydrogenase class IV
MRQEMLTIFSFCFKAVLIDPMLALTVPTLPTAQGALTSLGQCIESYLAGCGDDKTNHLALQGIEAIASGFAQPLVDGKFNLRSVAIREKFALGSLLSGICANASGFGGAHALAVSMGGVSHIAHMQVCASFLPLVLSKYSALAEENQGDPFFDEMVRLTMNSIVKWY